MLVVGFVFCGFEVCCVVVLLVCFALVVALGWVVRRLFGCLGLE